MDYFINKLTWLWRNRDQKGSQLNIIHKKEHKQVKGMDMRIFQLGIYYPLHTNYRGPSFDFMYFAKQLFVNL